MRETLSTSLDGEGRLRTAWKQSPGHVITLCALGLVTLGAVVYLLVRTAYPWADQPFPDAHEYLNTAYRLAHGQGYTTTVRDNPFSVHVKQAVNPPRYPPGTSLVLAPFALVGTYPGNVEFGSRLILVALVVVTAWAGYSLGGWYPALISGLIVAISPFALLNTRIVMSDVLGALLMVACLPLLRLQARWADYVLGVVAGYGVVCREDALIVVAVILIVVRGWDRRLRVAVGAAGPIAGLAVFNWSTFGAPWSTGYGYWLGIFPEYSLHYVTKHPWPPGVQATFAPSALELFHLAEWSHGNLTQPLPNLLFYPLVVLGFSTVFGPPFLTLVGLVVAARSWRRPEARFTLLVAGASVVVYMANFSQDPRFLAGPCILLTVWGVVGLVRLAGLLWDRYGRRIFHPEPGTVGPAPGSERPRA